MAKRTVTHKGIAYKVRSDSVDIPDLDAMDGLGAAMWLNRHTYPRGYSRPNPLAGLGGAVELSVR